jgi:hypothetical protein
MKLKILMVYNQEVDDLIPYGCGIHILDDE